MTHFKVGERIVTRWPHQSDYVFDERTGDAVDNFEYGTDPEDAEGGSAGADGNDDNGNFGDLGGMLKVPTSVAAEDAVWAWLWTLSAQCYYKSLFRPGETVAVVGLGTLGMGCIALGKPLGARIIGIANSPLRADMAMNNGADATFLYSDPDLQQKISDFTAGDGVDLVILTANPFPAHKTACEIVRNNGRVGIVALTGRGEPAPEFNPLDMNLFYAKGISLVAITGPEGDLYPAMDERTPWDSGYPLVTGSKAGRFTMELIEKGRLMPSKIITHRLASRDIPQAYDLIYERSKELLGCIFEWDTFAEPTSAAKL